MTRAVGCKPAADWTRVAGFFWEDPVVTQNILVAVETDQKRSVSVGTSR